MPKAAVVAGTALAGTPCTAGARLHAAVEQAEAVIAVVVAVVS